MLTIQEFRKLLAAVGEPVTLSPAKQPGQSYNLKAIIQPVSGRDEAIINAYGVGARTIQIAAPDLPAPPLKFDTVTSQGEKIVIDTVIAQHARGTGAVSSYLCYVKGK